jgi:quercetin dioxygenase-like cupin family protein
MNAFAIDRSDGRLDGEDWTENYEELPGGANISIILEATSKAGVGPRLHKHPYAETFIIRRGWATFTVGSEEFRGHAGQVLVVPAETPHKFSTGPDGYEGVHIHAGVRFVTQISDHCEVFNLTSGKLASNFRPVWVLNPQPLDQLTPSAAVPDGGAPTVTSP